MSLFTFAVDAGECVVEYRAGRPARVLSAGRHLRRRATRRVRVDLRAALLTLAPQEVLTSDGVGVRVTAVVRWAVGDPVAFVERAQAPTEVLYLAAQLGLRDAVAALSLGELTQRQTQLATQALTEVTAQAGRTVGIDVTGVVVRDVILPAELRHAATELLTARQRGLAALETARAETAALRALANAGRLLDDHPALARLRLVQAAPMGSQVVLRLGADAAEPVDR